MASQKSFVCKKDHFLESWSKSTVLVQKVGDKNVWISMTSLDKVIALRVSPEDTHEFKDNYLVIKSRKDAAKQDRVVFEFGNKKEVAEFLGVLQEAIGALVRE
ncbi:UNVERIFIED_CONTAM: hypothetical protein HDU68_008565 [Siphonaria sp. JEL0065]|nr:hypothetical protein HDU68_008565 [Siphonaria sp. JEL0065]